MTDIPIIIAGVKTPDSSMAKAATELVRDTETDLLYHHSRRVFLFGALTGDRKGPGGHILTGPVYVEGAEPGDVLEVKIVSIGASGAVTTISDDDPMCMHTTTSSSLHACQNGSQWSE